MHCMHICHKATAIAMGVQDWSLNKICGHDWYCIPSEFSFSSISIWMSCNSSRVRRRPAISPGIEKQVPGAYF